MKIEHSIKQSSPSHASCKMAMAIAANALTSRIAREKGDCQLSEYEIELLNKIRDLGEKKSDCECDSGQVEKNKG